MAITYHFDLYPRDDPEGGTRLVRFTALQSARFRGEANGSGSGQFSIRATDAEAAFIDPAGLQYVRVVRDDGSTELVVGGFFLESGDYSVLSETGDKLLTWGGAGPLNVLARAVMDADSWIDDPFIGTDPQPDGTWPLHLAGTGNSLGAILWRVLHELEEPGRHQNPLPFISLGFTHLLDSNGDPWVRTTGDFVAQVGDSDLTIAKRLMEMGLYVEVDPDTFEVRAYEPETHRRDRTGAAWGTNVVRFQAPSAATVATGNIKSDARRALEAKVRRNALLVGSKDTWEWVTDAGVTVPWEGSYHVDDEAGTSLGDAGDAQLAARGDAGDVLRLRMKLGSSPTTGLYLPFEHVKLDDLVTVHTGTSEWDFDEQTFPVAALTLNLRTGGDWDCWVDLGSTYTSMQERAFQAQPLKAHNHPPNPRLCIDRPFAFSVPIELLMKFRFRMAVTTQAHSLQLLLNDLDEATTLDFAVSNADGGGFSNQLGISRLVLDDKIGGSTSGPATNGILTTVDDVWCWLRVRADSSGQAMARLWKDGDAEPGTWDVETDDTPVAWNNAAVNLIDTLDFNPALGNTASGSSLEIDSIQFTDGFIGLSDTESFTRTVASGLGISEWNGQPYTGRSTNLAVNGTALVDTDDGASAEYSLSFPSTGHRCIHGGPNASTGDPGDPCGTSAAPCPHEHDYVAEGGATGQVLKKRSAANWDTEWGDAGGGPFEERTATNWKLTASITTLESAGGAAGTSIEMDDAYILAETPTGSFVYVDEDYASIGSTASLSLTMDASKHYLVNGNGVVVPLLGADPAGGDSQNGQIYYNTATHKFRGYANGAWVDLN